MSSQSPYIDQNAEKRMLESIAVFADILGFRKTMETAYEQTGQESLLKRFSTAVDSAYQCLEDSYDYPGKEVRLWQFKSFTDNIVIGFPLERLDHRSPGWSLGRSELRRIFEMLSFFQLTMITYDFFIRGGISLGPLYMDDNIAFGNALIRAYEAESKKAIYPRIVLDSLPRTEPLDTTYWSNWIPLTNSTKLESKNLLAPSMTQLVSLHSSGDTPGFPREWGKAFEEGSRWTSFLELSSGDRYREPGRRS